MLNISPSKMALAMMEAIVEFSKKNTKVHISLVRVVIFREEMVATYLEEMEKASKPGSSILEMVTRPLCRHTGDTIKGKHRKRCSFERRECVGVFRFSSILALKHKADIICFKTGKYRWLYEKD